MPLVDRVLVGRPDQEGIVAFRGLVANSRCPKDAPPRLIEQTGARRNAGCALRAG